MGNDNCQDKEKLIDIERAPSNVSDGGETRAAKTPGRTKNRLENMAVDPVGYILITVNGSTGPRGSLFWQFRGGRLSKTALWTHRGVGPLGNFAWEVFKTRLFRESENGRLCDTVAPNE